MWKLTLAPGRLTYFYVGSVRTMCLGRSRPFAVTAVIFGFHRSCQSMSESHYHVIGNTDTQWKCCRCNSQLSDAFHSYELYDTKVNVDSKLGGTSHPHGTAPRLRDSQRSRMSSQESISSPLIFCPTSHSTPQSPVSAANCQPAQRPPEPISTLHFSSTDTSADQSADHYQLRVGTGGHSY